MEKFCSADSNDSPTWGTVDVAIWKLMPAFSGGGRAYLRRFKDAWIKHNKRSIKAAADKFSLPVELLAGVCWIEVGGDPNIIDRLAFEVRTLNPFGTFPLLKTSSPDKTSFGWVSIQLRTAAITLGLDPEEMDSSQLRELSKCLERDIYNIELAAMHLRLLAEHDDLLLVDMHDIRIVGARYNRGAELPLDQIAQDTSYGDFIVAHWQLFTRLMM
jgi:hypothetical protein